MSRFASIPGFGKVSYASPEELLDFANKVREAAGADLLSSLPTGKLRAPESCLIANSLNFNSLVLPSIHLSRLPREVFGYLSPTEIKSALFSDDGWPLWVMATDISVAKSLDQKLDLKIFTYKEVRQTEQRIPPSYPPGPLERLLRSGFEAFVELPVEIGNAAGVFDNQVDRDFRKLIRYDL